jgi:hypothetical protein
MLYLQNEIYECHQILYRIYKEANFIWQQVLEKPKCTSNNRGAFFFIYAGRRTYKTY